jgi:hypothetical protein
MTELSTQGDAPSVFAISVVFGGIVGMSAAAAFGLDAGGGFIVGTALVFMFMSVAVLLSKEIERSSHSEDMLKLILATVARGNQAAEYSGEDSDFRSLISHLIDRDR